MKEEYEGPNQLGSASNLLEAKPLAHDNTVSSKPHIPSVSASAVLGESSSMPENTPICKGMDFDSKSKSIEDNDDDNNNEDIDMLSQVMKAFRHTGFQATNIGLAVEQIQQMRKWRLSHVPWKEGIDDPELRSIEIRQRLRARIFLAYTSNQVRT